MLVLHGIMIRRIIIRVKAQNLQHQGVCAGFVSARRTVAERVTRGRGSTIVTCKFDKRYKQLLKQRGWTTGTGQ